MHCVKAKSILSAKNGMNLYRGCSHGPNVIIGLKEIQSYQWFAGHLQEVLSYTVREITFTFVITSRRRSSPTIYSSASSAVSQTFSVSGLFAT